MRLNGDVLGLIRFVCLLCKRIFSKIWDADKRPGSFKQLKDTNKHTKKSWEWLMNLSDKRCENIS